MLTGVNQIDAVRAKGALREIGISKVSYDTLTIGPAVS